MRRPKHLVSLALRAEGRASVVAVLCSTHAPEFRSQAALCGWRVDEIRHPALLAALAEDEETGNVSCATCAGPHARLDLAHTAATIGDLIFDGWGEA